MGMGGRLLGLEVRESRGLAPAFAGRGVWARHLVTYAETSGVLTEAHKGSEGRRKGGGDDAADACRYLVATKAREVVQKKTCRPLIWAAYARVRLRIGHTAR